MKPPPYFSNFKYGEHPPGKGAITIKGKPPTPSQFRLNAPQNLSTLVKKSEPKGTKCPPPKVKIFFGEAPFTFFSTPTQKGGF